MGNENSTEILTDTQIKSVTDIMNEQEQTVKNSQNLNYTNNQEINIFAGRDIIGCSITATNKTNVNATVYANNQNAFTNVMKNEAKDEIENLVTQAATQKIESGLLGTPSGFGNKNKAIIENLTKQYVSKKIKTIIRNSLTNNFTENFKNTQVIKLGADRDIICNGEKLDFSNEALQRKVVTTMIDSAIENMMETAAGTEIKNKVEQTSSQSQTGATFGFGGGAAAIALIAAFFLIKQVIRWILLFLFGIAVLVTIGGAIYWTTTKEPELNEAQLLALLNNNVTQEDDSCFEDGCPVSTTTVVVDGVSYPQDCSECSGGNCNNIC